MKPKINLYALKLRNSTPQKDTPKRKLSLLKQQSNRQAPHPAPLHILKLANYDNTNYASPHLPTNEIIASSKDSRLQSTTVSLNSVRSVITLSLDVSAASLHGNLWGLHSPVNCLMNI